MSAITSRTGTVLITGTSTGIGWATALRLDRLGFDVVATVRRDEDGERLRAEASDRLRTIHLDVTDAAGIAAAAADVGDWVGERGLAGLVNNAGIGFAAPLEFAPLPAVERLFAVNVFGVLAVTQAFLPLLRRGRGRLVNVSSTASVFVAPFHGPYSATKLALNGLNHALRRELRPLGVDVILVICGSVNTPIWTKAADLGEALTGEIPAEATVVYGPRYERLRAFFGRMGEGGVAPAVAAAQIAGALTDRRPRNTVFVGPDARLFRVADRLLFGRLRDWVVWKTSGTG